MLRSTCAACGHAKPGTEEPPCDFSLMEAAVKALAWCPHDRHVLATGGGTADRCIKLWGVYRARAKHVDFGMVNNYNLGYYRPSGLPLVSKMPPVSDLYSEQSTSPVPKQGTLAQIASHERWLRRLDAEMDGLQLPSREGSGSGAAQSASEQAAMAPARPLGSVSCEAPTAAQVPLPGLD